MTKRKSSVRKLGEVAESEPKPIEEGSSVREAGERMREASAERFPVASKGKLVGTVEGAFLDREAAAFGHDPNATFVRESMSTTKFYCYAHQTVDEARKLMKENGLQLLPVVDGDLRFLGIVTLKDLEKLSKSR